MDSIGHIYIHFKNPITIKRLEIIKGAFEPQWENGNPLPDPEKGHVKKWRKWTVRKKLSNGYMFGGTADESTGSIEKGSTIQNLAEFPSRFSRALRPLHFQPK